MTEIKKTKFTVINFLRAYKKLEDAEEFAKKLGCRVAIFAIPDCDAMDAWENGRPINWVHVVVDEKTWPHHGPQNWKVG